MKILLVNKFYYLKGGAERYYFDLKELLENKGYEVISWSMYSKRNKTSPYSKYFVSQVDIEKPHLAKNKLKTAGRIIYSWEAKRKIASLIKDTKPDIAHLHNIYHQISPSILHVLKKNKIPTAMTVHDFKLMCPIYLFYTRGRVCERCKKYRYYNCVLQKCAKGSYSASAVNMVEMYVHRMLRIYKDNINVFICPSEFLKDKLVEYGFDESKLVVIPHSVESENIQAGSGEGKYILYFGRLSQEKGVKTLLRAMESLSEVNLKIAGSGPQEEELKGIVKDKGLNNVEFLGYLFGQDLTKVIDESSLAVVPSKSYETFGLAAAEALSHGKPVIASKLGALPEVVQDSQTGYLFESGNSDDLASKIRKMLASPEAVAEMGERGREYVEKNLSAERHYQELEKVYQKLE